MSKTPCCCSTTCCCIQVKIRFKKQTLNGQLANMVKAIKLVGNTVDYKFSSNAPHESHHKELFQDSNVKNVCRSMTKVRQFRNLIVTLPVEVCKLYTDDQNYSKLTILKKITIGTDKAETTVSSNEVEMGDQNELMKLCMNSKAQLALKEIT